MKLILFIVSVLFVGCQNNEKEINTLQEGYLNAQKDAVNALTKYQNALKDINEVKMQLNTALLRQADESEIIIVAEQELLLDNRILDALQAGDFKSFRQMIPGRNSLNKDLVQKLNKVYK